VDDKTFSKLAKLLTLQYDQFNNRVGELEKNMTNVSNKTYDRMDAVYKEVLAMRQEQSIHTGSHETINKELEDHEKRIKKLEYKRIAA
jgi:N-acetyl-beta-hexosaminidase